MRVAELYIEQKNEGCCTTSALSISLPAFFYVLTALRQLTQRFPVFVERALVALCLNLT